MTSTGGGNITCAQYLEQQNYTGATCNCTISFTLDQSFDVCRRDFVLKMFIEINISG